MKERPILMCGAMVKAILDNRKTQTRRIVKPQPFHHAIRGEDGIWYDADCINSGTPIPMKFGAVGDRLWVKEGFKLWDHSIDALEVEYIADGESNYVEMEPRKKREISNLYGRNMNGRKPIKPSIFMPRWASRITLEIVAVHVERLQEITEEDAKAEGCGMELHKHDRVRLGAISTFRAHYERLWDSINAKTHPWSSNPWVFVVSFNASLRDHLSPQ